MDCASPVCQGDGLFPRCPDLGRRSHSPKFGIYRCPGQKSRTGSFEGAAKAAKAALILPTYEGLKDSKGNKITSKQYANLASVNTLLANIYAWMGGLTENSDYWTQAEAYASTVIEGKAGAYELESIEDLVPHVFGKKRSSHEVISASTTTRWITATGIGWIITPNSRAIAAGLSLHHDGFERDCGISQRLRAVVQQNIRFGSE